jgi:hypothetical protein
LPTRRASPRVLIGFAEALAAPEVAWSLRDAGFTVIAFTRRGRRPPLRRSRSVRLVEIASPEVSARAAETELRQLASWAKPDVVMPLDDFSIYLCGRAFDGTGIVAGPTGERLRVTLDKRLQLEAAHHAGFDVPKTRMLTSPEEALGESAFPAVLKPALAAVCRAGRLGRGAAFVCANRNELEQAVRAMPSGEPVLVQPLLNGVGQGLFGVATARGITAWSAHQRLRMTNPQGSGSSACMNIPVDSILVAPATRMLTAAGWKGLFMIETLRDREGVTWFMEVNGRPWGSMALARRQGLEYPAWAVEQMLDDGFEPPTVRLNGGTVTCRHLAAEIIHMLFVLRGARSAALTNWPPRFRTILDICRFRRSDRWYNWRSDEPLVFVDDTVRTVCSQILRR